MARLSDAEIEAGLKNLAGWERRDKAIEKTFTFKSFSPAVVFVGAVGYLANVADHHPDIRVHGYKYVTLTLSTHSEGGITRNDLDLAAKIESLGKGSL